jgi:DsbE subfamily thiol:disulfide oxidoreductase
LCDAEVALQAQAQAAHSSPAVEVRDFLSRRLAARLASHRRMDAHRDRRGGFVLNDIAWIGAEVMPGGHSELYLLLGLLVAGFGSWWTGRFDRPSPPAPARPVVFRGQPYPRLLRLVVVSCWIMPTVLPDRVSRPATARGAGRIAVLGLTLVVLPALLVGSALAIRRQTTADGLERFTITAAQQPAEAQVPRRVVELEGTLLADGQPWSSAAIRGSVLVVNYWASWCTPCRAEQPRLTRVARDYAAQGVTFIGVNVNDDRGAARTYLRDFDVPYPSLFDPRTETAARLGVVGLPTTFIVDRGGVLGYQRTGEATVASLTAQLEALLAIGGRWGG